MNFAFSAEWPLSPGDTNWLAAYFAERWLEGVRLCRIRSLIDGSSFDPFAARTPFTTTDVLLKADNWTNPDAPNGAAGMFFQPELHNAPRPVIWINWNREFDPTNNLYNRIVRHELIHLMLWLQSGVGYQYWQRDFANSGHGALAPNDDPFVLAVNRFVNEVWPKNHSSWPGSLLER